MLKCPSCSREYASQSSLNRHAQNHRKSKQHTCSVCSVVFYRRDLLNRHMAIHNSQRSNPPNSSRSRPSSSPGPSMTQSRRRCHTACVLCRQNRSRCSGGRPCVSCMRTGNTCEYSLEGSRISDAPIPEVFPSTTDGDSWLPDQEAMIAEQLPVAHFEESRMLGGLVPMDQVTTDETTLIQDDFFQDLNLSWMGHPSDRIAWPWLHETMFLQQNPTSSGSFAGFLNNCVGDGNYTDQEMGATSELPDYQSMGNSSFRPQLREESITQSDIVGSLRSTTSAGNDGPSEERELETVPPSPESETLKLGKQSQQSRTVADIVISSSELPWPPRSKTAVLSHWQDMSSRIEKAFSIGAGEGGSDCSTLEHFISLYFEHFGPLWPLICKHNMENTSLHPLLYLTLSSIGAMYGGHAQSLYGSMMHNQIRKSLTAPLELEDSKDDFLWLAQSRLLTQVAALYFGQAKAFSYAQHLGGLLVAQARRMNLFSVTIVDDDGSEPRPAVETLARWLQRESRRRLAFGILRGDVYTSILLNIRPLVSPEEFDMELPGSDLVWGTEQMPANVCLQIIEQDKSLGRRVLFSDMHRIALDEEEPFPALEPIGSELLLFALQPSLWRYSRDPHMFQRLTGEEMGYSSREAQGMLNQASYFEAETTQYSPSASSTRGADVFEVSSRQMLDLQRGYRRVTLALSKWKQSLSLTKMFVQSDRDRTSLLGSLILYHLSYLRLHAPIGDLHQISHQLADRRSIEKKLIKSVHQWANTPHAKLAVDHAISIWALIMKETARPKGSKYTLVAFTGLHHGAVVLWGYIGAHDFSHEIPDSAFSLVDPNNTRPNILVGPSQLEDIMSSYIQLYRLISSGRWSSFARAAINLSTHSFPSAEE
ncbi:hypothetical protein BKA65DRAFT_395334 [Rhexocercosporidium sp. MPI-PUGE-AT-0058]|nr:hypothetical protein BKA65DRAFT_395334 [Rhexocercosporidium sp. MPI-PUGE-AT-0058]